MLVKDGGTSLAKWTLRGPFEKLLGLQHFIELWVLRACWLDCLLWSAILLPSSIYQKKFYYHHLFNPACYSCELSLVRTYEKKKIKMNKKVSATSLLVWKGLILPRMQWGCTDMSIAFPQGTDSWAPACKEFGVTVIEWLGFFQKICEVFAGIYLFYFWDEI